MHADRELKLVAPRGRPQKQCQHCRTARGSRSHHAKCDCGEKREKLLSYTNGVVTIDFLRKVKHSCCCIHGEQCICGKKRGTDFNTAQRTIESKPNFSVSAVREHTNITAGAGLNTCRTVSNAAHTSGTSYQTLLSQTSHNSTAEQAIFPDLTRSQTKSNNVSQRVVDDPMLSPNTSIALGTMTGTSHATISIPRYSIDSLLPTNQLNTAGADAFGTDCNITNNGPPSATPTTTSTLVSYAAAHSSDVLTAEQWFDSDAAPINLESLDDYSIWSGAEFSDITGSEWRVLPADLNLSQSIGSLPFDPNKNLSDFFWPLPYSEEFN